MSQCSRLVGRFRLLSHALQLKNMLGRIGTAAGFALGQLAQQISRQATLLACLDCFLAIACIGVAGSAGMLAQRVMK